VVPASASGPYVQKFLMPPYPNIARKLYIQGEVSATVRVLGNGTVESVTASSGPKPLKESVEEALKQWTFVVPDQQETDLRITFSFVLEENESDACIFQVSGVLPNHFEIKINYGPHMK
jgi:TonB family protein